MYVGILKFWIEVEGTPSEAWQRAAKSLCEKLRARFKVVARAEGHQTEDYCIGVVMLGPEAGSLQRLFDRILDFSEGSGVGRVIKEVLVVEHLDVFLDDDESDDT